MGDRLLPCFRSESQIPFSDVNLYTGHAHAPEWGPDSSVSEVSTIQLEFRDLSMATGNLKYKVHVLLYYKKNEHYFMRNPLRFELIVASTFKSSVT